MQDLRATPGGLARLHAAHVLVESRDGAPQRSVSAARSIGRAFSITLVAVDCGQAAQWAALAPWQPCMTSCELKQAYQHTHPPSPQGCYAAAARAKQVYKGAAEHAGPEHARGCGGRASPARDARVGRVEDRSRGPRRRHASAQHHRSRQCGRHHAL